MTEKRHVRVGVNAIVATLWTTCSDCAEPTRPGQVICMMDVDRDKVTDYWLCIPCLLVRLEATLECVPDALDIERAAAEATS